MLFISKNLMKVKLKVINSQKPWIQKTFQMKALQQAADTIHPRVSFCFLAYSLTFSHQNN
jgi:hypothetical protein